MKQTINLLPLKPKVVRNWLAFNHVLTVLTLIVVALLATGSGLWWQGAQIKQLNAQQLNDNLSTQATLVALTAQLEKRKTPYKLNNQRFELQQQTRAMQQMVDITRQSDLTRTTGFLNLVDSIRISMPEKSQIQHFKVGPNQSLISLKGSVAKVEDVPKLIDNLRGNNLLHNQKISSINVQHGGDNHSFELLSERRGN